MDAVFDGQVAEQLSAISDLSGRVERFPQLISAKQASDLYDSFGEILEGLIVLKLFFPDALVKHFTRGDKLWDSINEYRMLAGKYLGDDDTLNCTETERAILLDRARSLVPNLLDYFHVIRTLFQQAK